MKMLKVCKVCGELKEESEFPIHSEGRLRSTCKDCWNTRNRTKRAENADKYRERSRKYYEQNKEKVIERTKLWGKTHRKSRRKSVQDMRERRRKEIWEYKESQGCLICKENDPACLDFHHLDESQKEDNIAELTMSRTKLEKEIKKCIILCSNCHRKLHYYGKEHFLTYIAALEGLQNKFEEQ